MMDEALARPTRDSGWRRKEERRTWTARLRSWLRSSSAWRAQLGAKWCVVMMLLPVVAHGCIRFGPRAALVVALSVVACTGLGIVTRWLSKQPWRVLNPGTLITGTLLGLTLSAETPLYMVLVGAAVAEVAGKVRLPWLGRNPFNPAALGRAAVAVLELSAPAPPAAPDVISAASPLYVGAGGSPAPELGDMLLGLTSGAIGETGTLVLALVGIPMLWVIVPKRLAAFAMLVAVASLTVLLPATSEIHGHAPWVLDPVTYLAGGPVLLYAVFFATDPATSPRTRIGGILFGAGAGALGMVGRLYLGIPGSEMWAILAMNLAAPGVDRLVAGRDPERAVSPAPSVDSFFAHPTKRVDASSIGHEVGFDALDSGADERFGVLASCEKRSVQELIEHVASSGLAGRGGAGFPASRKWSTALGFPGPRALVVNGQEGEPDSSKDRTLMQLRPELVIEGAAIVAHVIDATEVVLVTEPGHTEGRDALTRALGELEAAQPEMAARFRIVDGPGLYVCGEETALINYLEGRRGEPRDRPPFPAEAGLFGMPTVVHNVETLSWLPRILARPGESAALRQRLITLSGRVRHPGVYVAASDSTLEQLVRRGGGLCEQGRVRAFAVGGPSGEIIPGDHAGRTIADLPGTASVRVLGSDDCVVAEVLAASRFFAAETCGRCTPCRVGTGQLAKLWGEIADGRGSPASQRLIEELAELLSSAAMCGLGTRAPSAARSALEHFPEEVGAHLRGEPCDACAKVVACRA